MTETQIISTSVQVIVQCMCGEMFAITKALETVVCRGCLQVYRLSPLQVELVDDANFESVLLGGFSE